MSKESKKSKSGFHTWFNSILGGLAFIVTIFLAVNEYMDSTRQENLGELEAQEIEEALVAEGLIERLKINSVGCGQLSPQEINYFSTDILARLPPRYQRKDSEKLNRKPGIDRTRKVSTGRGDIFKYVVENYPQCYGKFLKGESPFVEMLFIKQQLSGLKAGFKYDFRGDKYERVYFRNCNLYRSRFTDCEFVRVDMGDTYFISTDFKDVLFKNSTLGAVKFINCTFENVKFENLQFKDRTFPVEFIHCKFDDPDAVPAEIIAKLRGGIQRTK